MATIVSAMKLVAAVFLLLGARAFTVPGRGDEIYRELFFTVREDSGEIDTVHLRVPKSGGGPCEFVGISLPDISDVRAPVPTIIWSSTTNFTSSSAPPSPPGRVLSSRATMELARIRMTLKYLGTLTTTKGDTYTCCWLLAFQKDGVIVIVTEGVLKIIFSDLDAISRRRVEAAR